MADLIFPASIWCVGRNYADHARELGNASPAQGTDSPMIFLKSGGALVPPGKPIRLPTWSNEIHHEVELAFRFGAGTRTGAELQLTHYAIALDLTARDAQAKLKERAQPWTLAKSFRDSCPLSELKPLEPADDPQAFEFWLEVNGERRQFGRARDMIFSIEEAARFVQERFPVREGDLLLTGTPAGVGPLRRGDHVIAEIKGRTQAEWSCV